VADDEVKISGESSILKVNGHEL